VQRFSLQESGWSGRHPRRLRTILLAHSRHIRFAIAIAMLPAIVAAQAGDASTLHADPVVPVVLGLAVILAAAKLAGALAGRIGQPAVLGELAAGVLLGSLDLTGVGWFSALEHDATIQILASLGVIILLFEVGLESTVRDMLKVGVPSLLVAVLGVVAPFALGWGVGWFFLPDRSVYVHAFLGATLTATSVGVTARVLQDLGKSRSPEARIILGAAVIDDVLGLVILAVVGGVIAAVNSGGTLSYLQIATILAKAVGFLFGALALGSYLSPRVFTVASRLHGRGVLLTTALVFCFALAFASSAIGLAPIVGAYAAGLILEDVHFKGFAQREHGRLEDLVHPISIFLVPVFFVATGMRVDLTAFGRIEVLGLAAALTVAAIIGKQACSLGAFGASLDRVSIGLGMIPRGEVGLIFANLGLGLTIAGRPVVDTGIFSAVVIMVILTTMVTPSALKWSFSRNQRTDARPKSGGTA
jgi:Kef-type K+ transport system membrane component KefB